MTVFFGLRGTGQFDADHRPKNYRETYTLLEPNGEAPLNALLAMSGSESTNDPSFKNFRDELPARAFQVNNGAGYDASATTIAVDAVDAVKYVTAGAVLVNVNTGEVMHATSAGDATGGSIAVERNIGGTAFTVSDDDEIIVAGYAAKEGADVGESVSFDATVTESYCQIFRTPYTLTETQRHTYLRTGSKEAELEEKALKLHMSDIERSHFFSQKAIKDENSAQPTRFTQGLFNAIQYNQIDAASDPRFATVNTITEAEFDRLLIDQIFAYGSQQKLAFVGPRIAGHIHEFGKDRWQPTTVSGTYGVSMTGYQTPAGTLMTRLHPQFRQIKGMENACVIIDMAHVKFRHLEGRDTSLLEGRQGPGHDSIINEFLTECGLELLQDKPHAVIRNWVNNK